MWKILGVHYLLSSLISNYSLLSYETTTCSRTNKTSVSDIRIFHKYSWNVNNIALTRTNTPRHQWIHSKLHIYTYLQHDYETLVSPIVSMWVLGWLNEIKLQECTHAQQSTSTLVIKARNNVGLVTKWEFHTTNK